MKSKQIKNYNDYIKYLYEVERQRDRKFEEDKNEFSIYKNERCEKSSACA